jgi:hypothetical protein
VNFRGRWFEGQCAAIPDLDGKQQKLDSEGMPAVLVRTGLSPALTIAQIAAVGFASYALDEEGRLWYWGKCAFSVLLLIHRSVTDFVLVAILRLFNQ